MTTDTLYEGRFLRMVRQGRWEYVQRTKASAVVAIIATTPAHEILLIEQPRVPLGSSIIELPAGLVGDDIGHEDEPLIDAAKRELDEETGYSALTWSVLTRGPTSAGLTNEVITLLRASDAMRTGTGGGVAGEQITVHAIPLTTVSTWLAAREKTGQLVDPKVYAGLWFAGRI
jgi:ADP-ribose pyrophosphatase